MAANYVLLERIELNASAASVTFSNIPQSGYTDLKVVASARGTQASASNAFTIRFNGATTGYSTRELVSDGSNASSASRTNLGSAMYLGNIDGNSATASTYSNTEIYIPNYNSTTTNKSISVDNVSENNGTEAYATFIAGLYSSTSAITSIDLVSLAAHGVLMAGSTFSLYGLAASGTTPAIAPYASGGNITTDGTYWYHTFLASGRFTPAKSLSCDVLTIAGGGSGGNNASGGGGAGGLLYSSAQAVESATNYIVAVGAGGANQTSYSSSGFNGSNSTLSGSGFTTLTAIGGGAGQGPVSTPAGSGGSGGGASGYSGSSARGTGTSGQGNNGGTATVPGESGGGGGAGAAGGNGGNNSARNGVGGAGVNTYSAWASATGTGVSGYYAGGGGGGAGQSTSSGTSGGAGGGGTGAGVDQNTLATAGTINTGSGGGGTGYGNTSGSSNTGGGSGIVIIRYAI